MIACEAYSDGLASIASSSELSIVDPAVSKNTVTKKEKPTGGVKLKKSIAKKTKPKDTESNGESPTSMHHQFKRPSSKRVYQVPRQVGLLEVPLLILLPSMVPDRRLEKVKASPNATTAKNLCPSPPSLPMPSYAKRRKRWPARRRKQKMPRLGTPKRRKPPKKKTKTATP